MRSDDDVDAALPEQLEDFLLLTLRPKAAEHFDPDRIIEHSLAKNFEVLLRKDGGRGQHHHLMTVHHRFERGSNRDLGFAEADIAANQSVHWARTFHVDL